MKHPTVLYGQVRCRECRDTWTTAWNVRAPVVICHQCGASCEPVGLQTSMVPGKVEGELFRLEILARYRGMN